MKVIKLLDYVFVLRPMLHVPVWTIMILGYYRHTSVSRSSLELFLLLILGSLLSGGVFLVNQIYDIKSDRLNEKLYFLARSMIKVRTAWLMSIVLDLVAVALAFALSRTVGITSTLIILLGIAYSVSPVALKDRPWPAVSANGVGHGTLVFVIGYAAAGGNITDGIMRSIPYFFAVASIYIGTTLPDMEGDRKAGKGTVAVVYGEKTAKLLAMACYVSSVAAGLAVGDLPFLIAAVAVAPFHVWAVYSGIVANSVIALKASILTLSLAASYFTPLYFIFLIALIAVTRWYYRVRFSMTYPSFR